MHSGPDLPEAKAYRLALPPPRHDSIKSYRVVVIDEHPLIPTANSIRVALDRLASQLEKLGCRVGAVTCSYPGLGTKCPAVRYPPECMGQSQRRCRKLRAATGGSECSPRRHGRSWRVAEAQFGGVFPGLGKCPPETHRDATSVAPDL